MSAAAPFDAEAIDRLRELASIGAGHAATALAGLTGRVCEMEVPAARLAAREGAATPPAEPGLTGVMFELSGGPGGVLALLFPASTCQRLLEHLLGPGAGARDEEARRSALSEVGNILASHAADAVAETLGVAVWPSVPHFVLGDASAALAELIAAHHADAPFLRVETEISDRAGELRGLFVFVPDAPARVAPRGAV